MAERLKMEADKGLSCDEIDMLETLGLKLTLAGEILTASFPSTGYREEWIATELPIERLIGCETLTLGGRRFVLVEKAAS